METSGRRPLEARFGAAGGPGRGSPRPAPTGPRALSKASRGVPDSIIRRTSSGWAASSAIALPIASARAVPSEPATPALIDHLAESADRGCEHRPVVHERLAGGVRPALPQGRDHHDVGSRMWAPTSLRGTVPPKWMRSSSAAISSSCFCMEAPSGAVSVSAPEEGQLHVRAREARDRAQQVLHALAAFEAPEIEQPQRAPVTRDLTVPRLPRSRRRTRREASSPARAPRRRRSARRSRARPRRARAPCPRG